MRWRNWFSASTAAKIGQAEIAAIASSKGVETLSRDQVHEIRDLTIMLRKRKLKPEKGRRKDLRKIDSLIRDLHSVTHPGATRGVSR